MLLKIITLLSLLAFASVSVASDRPRNVNVCDLSRLAEQIDGKIVRVHGVLRNSDTMENPYFDELVGENCNGVDGGQVTIQVVSPDSHFLASPPPGYKPDFESVRRAEPVFKKAAADRRSVSATVEGVFYTSKQQTSSPARHRQYQASIVIQGLRDVKER